MAATIFRNPGRQPPLANFVLVAVVHEYVAPAAALVITVHAVDQ